MNVHYINCFHVGDPAAAPLTEALESWKSGSRHVDCEEAVDGEHLRARIDRLWRNENVPDVLIVGGHGHDSLSGFWVRRDAVRWHDLAFLLREQAGAPFVFIFYSCNGGYPGIAHAFGRANRLDFVFGPRIKVSATVMTHATVEILCWRECAGNNPASATPASARALVDQLNKWGAANHGATHNAFLRVIWAEGQDGRHPDVPHGQNPIGPTIPLRAWGLD